MEQVAQRKELRTPSGLIITFKHEKGSWPLAVYRRGKKVEIAVTRRTICEITSDGSTPTGETSFYTKGSYGYGQAMCSPSDNFEYELGRQYALREALKDAPRPVRAEVMQSYLGRTGAKPWRLDKNGHAKLQLTKQQIDRVTDSAVAGALAALL